jgi:hypothetical protein
MTAKLASGATAAELEAARLLLARMGISPAELLQAASSQPAAPTFAEYVPVVSAAVSAGTRRVYGSYWNRIVDQWGQRRLDEPTPTDVERLAEHVRIHVVARRNARGGRSAAEHLIAALRCLYNHAVADGLKDASSRIGGVGLHRLVSGGRNSSGGAGRTHTRGPQRRSGPGRVLLSPCHVGPRRRDASVVAVPVRQLPVRPRGSIRESARQGRRRVQRV